MSKLSQQFYANDLARVEALMQMRRWGDARDAAADALAGSPNDGALMARMSFCSFRLGEIEKADELADDALEANPLEPYCHMVRGVLLRAMGHPAPAVEVFLEVLRLDPSIAQAHAELAASYLSLRMLDEAWLKAQDALRLTPNDDFAHSIAALILLEKDEPAEALKQVRQALVLNPDSSVSHGVCGRVLLRMDRCEESLFHLLEALRINPDDTHAKRFLPEAIARQNWFYRQVLRRRRDPGKRWSPHPIDVLGTGVIAIAIISMGVSTYREMDRAQDVAVLMTLVFACASPVWWVIVREFMYQVAIARLWLKPLASETVSPSRRYGTFMRATAILWVAAMIVGGPLTIATGVEWIAVSYMAAWLMIGAAAPSLLAQFVLASRIKSRWRAWFGAALAAWIAACFLTQNSTCIGLAALFVLPLSIGVATFSINHSVSADDA
jgi:tetratricopeptide (TPR) repeat protein